MGVAVVAEEVLDGGAGGDEPDPHRGHLGRDEVEGVEEGGPALGQQSGRGEGGGAGHEQAEPGLVLVVGQEPQRGLVPAGGGGGARGAAVRAASSSRATAWASPGRADRST